MKVYETNKSLVTDLEEMARFSRGFAVKASSLDISTIIVSMNVTGLNNIVLDLSALITRV